ncbi:MAG: energy transducer TonB [Gemmatimonadaceae bacterium]
MPAGSVTGSITAAGANGQVVKGANILVTLWTTDATTEAKRDSACAMWLADKTIWMQAKGEVESPSGVNWTGTAVGNDLTHLNSLLALRRDTVRSDANGEFIFASVPFGAYTVEAETFANNKFLQWSKDAPVIPGRKTRVDLDATTLTENQYCPLPDGGAGSGQAYNLSDLDAPLKLLSGAVNASPSAAQNGTVTIDFVVDAKGVPDQSTVIVKSTTGTAVTADAARTIVSKLRYSTPTVKGNPVRVTVEYVAPIPSDGGGRRRR